MPLIGPFEPFEHLYGRRLPWLIASALAWRMNCASMAVLIMPLVPAVASGIAFTCDPMSGREDRLVIHANWGLGESLVGGLAVGDEIILEEDFGDESLTLISTVTGSKSVSVVPSSGGGTQTRAPS